VGLLGYSSSAGGGLDLYNNQLNVATLQVGIAMYLFGGNWIFKTATDNTHVTNIDTGVPWQNRQTWIEFRAELPNKVDAYIDNVLVASSSTNLPAVNATLYLSLTGNGGVSGDVGLYLASLKMWERLTI